MLAELCTIHVLVDDSVIPWALTCVFSTNMVWNSFNMIPQHTFPCFVISIFRGIDWLRRRQGPFSNSVSILNDNDEPEVMCGLILRAQFCFSGLCCGSGSDKYLNSRSRV